MEKKRKEHYLIPDLTNSIKSPKIFYNREYKMAIILWSSYFW